MRKFFTLLLFSSAFYVNGQDFTLSSYTQPNTKIVAVADFDGDGYADILSREIPNLLSNFFLLKNNKTADVSSFESTQILANQFVQGGPFVFDIDKDGDMDIIYTSSSSNSYNALINDGKANFTLTPLGASGLTVLKFADMDKDGDIDIVGFNKSLKTISLSYNNGSSYFPNTDAIFSDPLLTQFTLGELNNDGLPEIIVCKTTATGEQVIALINDGGGYFSKRVVAKDKYADVTDVIVHDINKDGRNDIIILNKGSIELALAKTSPTYTDKTLISTDLGGNVITATFADVTGEGENDLLICTDKSSIWLKNINKTDFTYEKRVLSDVSGNVAFSTGDLNKDGALDIVYASNGLKILINKISEGPSNVVDVQSNIRVYPNPAKDVIQIDGLEGDGYRAHFYNNAGTMMLNADVLNGKVDVYPLNTGSYIFSILNSEGKVIGNGQIVKE
jgi:hypothetical protein